MWWCKVVLGSTGYQYAVVLSMYIVCTQYNELTCHCHTVSMTHHPQVLCTEHRVQTCRSVGGWKEGERRWGFARLCAHLYTVGTQGTVHMARPWITAMNIGPPLLT